MLRGKNEYSTKIELTQNSKHKYNERFKITATHLQKEVHSDLFKVRSEYRDNKMNMRGLKKPPVNKDTRKITKSLLFV